MLNALLFLFVLLVNAPCFQQPLLFCVVLGGVKRQARLEIFFKCCVRKLCSMVLRPKKLYYFLHFDNINL